MAIPWVIMLQAVPWDKVINNAPKMVEGAQKLFSRLKGRKPEAPESIKAIAAEIDLMDEAQIRVLIEQNQQKNAALQKDLQDAVQLIEAIANQNAQMVSEIELLRKRTIRLQRLCFVLIVAVLIIALVMLRK